MIPSPKQISLAYKMRPKFRPFHTRDKRFSVLVCHRRAGKTYAAIHEILAQALSIDITKRPNPRYGYVAPYRTQVKELVWTYLKDAVKDLPSVKVSESELSVTLHNGARIKLYGADNPDTLRGGYFDGVILDEFGDMKGVVWSEVVRPMLSDRKGWVVFLGTPRGKNTFYDICQRAQKDPKNWFYLCLKASTSGHLKAEEIADMKRDMTDDQIERELECNFDATIEGSFYGKQMTFLQDRGRIKRIPYNPDFPVDTGWDLGRKDNNCIWFSQFIGGERRLIDYYETKNKFIEDIIGELAGFGYQFGTNYLPHDARHERVEAKFTVIQSLRNAGFECKIVERDKKLTGIHAVRKMLPTLAFDADKCAVGIEHLKNYTRDYDHDKKVFSEEPKHDVASHGADALRTLVMGLPLEEQEAQLERNVRMHPELKPATVERFTEKDEPAQPKVNTPIGYTFEDLVAMEAEDYE